MKSRLTICMLLASIPGLAAAAGPVARISDLAAVTGLTERQVQMVVGDHTAYPEYLTTYDWRDNASSMHWARNATTT